MRTTLSSLKLPRPKTRIKNRLASLSLRVFLAIWVSSLPVVGAEKGGKSPDSNATAPAVEAGAKNLPEDAPVITVEYACAAKSPSGSCTVTVSKKEFDALVAALDPRMPLANRQALATEYSRLLIMAAEAQRRNIDQSPQFETLLRFTTLQLLSTRLVREIDSNPPMVSPSQVENYFREHADDYREVLLSRIFVPSASTGEHAVSSDLARVEAIHARAVKGENFAGLQREAGTPGADDKVVSVGPLRCGSLPEDHRQVCKLKTGEISLPVRDKFGYTIYKLQSGRSLRLDEVRGEITAMLQRQQVEGEIRKVRSPLALQLEPRYFGPLPNLDVAHKHGMHTPPSATPAGAASEHRHE